MYKQEPNNWSSRRTRGESRESRIYEFYWFIANLKISPSDDEDRPWRWRRELQWTDRQSARQRVRERKWWWLNNIIVYVENQSIILNRSYYPPNHSLTKRGKKWRAQKENSGCEFLPVNSGARVSCHAAGFGSHLSFVLSLLLLFPFKW